LNQCKHNAKQRGLEFSLTLKWVEQRLQSGVCEVTGIAFVRGTSRHPFLPSIDRIDSDKGYTPENCRVVLWIINAAKQALPEDDFQSALRQVAEAVVERFRTCLAS
jgi:hypothetical protein